MNDRNLERSRDTRQLCGTYGAHGKGDFPADFRQIDPGKGRRGNDQIGASGLDRRGDGLRCGQVEFGTAKPNDLDVASSARISEERLDDLHLRPVTTYRLGSHIILPKP